MDVATFTESAEKLGHRAGQKIDEAKGRASRLNGWAMTFIQKHPAACLLGALAVGYLVARVARHHR